MDQSLKKILHKIWDKSQVYDEKLIRKFLTGYKELDSLELRKEFRNWLGGDDVVFNKVEEFLSKPKHARVGGYDFDYKPINWDINVSNNHDMWVELDSSVVDANGKVTLGGYDGNTYDIGEVMSQEEFSGEDSISWEVDDEINDIVKDQLKDLLMKNFGVDLIYYHNLVYDDQAFDKSLREGVEENQNVFDYKEGRNTVPMEDRYNFDIDKLVNAGAIFITPPMDGDPNSPTYKEWLDIDGSHLIILYNVMHSSEDGWIRKVITKSANTLGWRDNFIEKLYDGKYNQILWSLEKLGIDPNDMVIENNSLQESIIRIREMIGLITEGPSLQEK